MYSRPTSWRQVAAIAIALIAAGLGGYALSDYVENGVAGWWLAVYVALP